MKLLAIAAAAVALVSAAPAVDLSGIWTLDTDLSDNSQQVAAAINADLHLQPDTAFVMTGSRSGGFGGRRDVRRANDKPPSADEQQRIDELTMALRYPAPTLTIAQNGDSVLLTDAQGHTRTLTRWEGPEVVATTDLGGGRRLTASYSIVAATRQLMVRTTIERAPNEPGPFEIKQVYDRATATR